MSEKKSSGLWMQLAFIGMIVAWYLPGAEWGAVGTVLCTVLVVLTHGFAVLRWVPSKGRGASTTRWAQGLVVVMAGLTMWNCVAWAVAEPGEGDGPLMVIAIALSLYCLLGMALLMMLASPSGKIGDSELEDPAP